MATSKEEVLSNIKDGDLLKWENSFGTKCAGTVGKIIRSSESPTIGGTVEFYEQVGGKGPYRFFSFHRVVALSHVTHVNGRKLSNMSSNREKRTVDFPNEDEARQTDLSLGAEEEEAKMAQKLQTTTRKSLDEMSDSHRRHVERWEPHLEALRGQHVWAAVARIPGRGVEGPHYVALKRGAKDYVIVDYDTEKMTPATPKRILADGFESSGTLMEAFREFRTKAKAEREAVKSTATKPKAKAAASRKKATVKKTVSRKKAPAKAS